MSLLFYNKEELFQDNIQEVFYIAILWLYKKPPMLFKTAHIDYSLLRLNDSILHHIVIASATKYDSDNCYSGKA